MTHKIAIAEKITDFRFGPDENGVYRLELKTEKMVPGICIRFTIDLTDALDMAATIVLSTTGLAEITEE